MQASTGGDETTDETTDERWRCEAGQTKHSKWVKEGASNANTP
jgi:hypothetical protein